MKYNKEKKYYEVNNCQIKAIDATRFEDYETGEETEYYKIILEIPAGVWGSYTKKFSIKEELVHQIFKYAGDKSEDIDKLKLSVNVKKNNRYNTYYIDSIDGIEWKQLFISE